MKLGAPETLALSAALLDTGTNAELAASSIQKLLMASTNAKGQAGFAKTMGVEVDDFAAQIRTKPMEAIQGFLRALKGMIGGLKMAGALSFDQGEAIKAKLYADLARSDLAKEDLKPKRDDGPKFAGAHEIGGQEARSSILAARGMGGRDGGIKGVESNTKNMVARADRQLQLTRQLVSAIRDQGQGRGFTALPI
ncbi:MAG: hypothetical protein WKF75_00430 [Singulisphaera sp.]